MLSLIKVEKEKRVEQNTGDGEMIGLRLHSYFFIVWFVL